MAQAIRRLGLKLIVAALRRCTRPATAGWQRSGRSSTLRGA